MASHSTHTDPAVEVAAICLADEQSPPHHVIPYLRERFNLSTVQASKARALAQQFRLVRKAFG